MRFFAKEVNSKGFRGFESHPDRHFCLIIIRQEQLLYLSSNQSAPILKLDFLGLAFLNSSRLHFSVSARSQRVRCFDKKPLRFNLVHAISLTNKMRAK